MTGGECSSVDVVIVNWNAGSQLRECLSALARSDRDAMGLSIIVVDNGSTDGSAGDLSTPGIALRVIRNAGNRGFAAACNQGAHGSTADYLLFLNPDTRVDRDSIARAVALLESPAHAATGVCGIRLLDEHGHVSRSCARLPTPRQFLAHAVGLDRIWPRRFPGHVMSEWDHGQSRHVDHVIGAFYLVRRTLFELLGGFDERFFVYLEDLDFSLRARLKGASCFYLADAQAYHKGGGSSEQAKDLRLSYAVESRILYGYKHFDRVSATLLMLSSLLVEPIVRTLYAACRGAGAELGHTMQGYALLWRRLARLRRSAS